MTKQTIFLIWAIIGMMILIGWIQGNRINELETRIGEMEEQGYDLNINLMAPEPGEWELLEQFDIEINPIEPEPVIDYDTESA